jgi:hypothetical protein
MRTGPFSPFEGDTNRTDTIINPIGRTLSQKNGRVPWGATEVGSTPCIQTPIAGVKTHF